MAEETILLDVKFDASKAASEAERLAEQIADLKKQQADLNAEFKAGTISSGEYAKASDDIKTKTSNLTKEMKGLFAQIRETDKATEQRTGSLNEERAALANMLKAYDSLSAAERDNEEIGGALLKNIQEQTDKVQNLEKATGRHQRNVGNYPSALQPAIGILNKMGVSLEALEKGGTKAFAGLGQSAKALGKTMLTPPVGLIVGILAALMFAFSKLSEAFKKNDEAGTDLAVALSALKPIGELIRSIFDGLAVVIGKVAKGFANAVTSIVGVAEKLHLLPDGYREAAKAAAELVIAQDNLEETERQYTINSAKRSKEVSELRAKAIEEQDPKKRRALLEEAISLEEADLEDRKRIAAEKLHILEATAKQERDTSDETANAIAQARADMYKAEQEYFDGTRRLRSQLVAADKEAQAEEKKILEERKKRYEDYQKKIQEQTKTRIEIEDKAADLAVSLIKDEGERRIAERKIQGEREIRQLQEQLKTDKSLTKESRAELNQLIIDMQAALDNELRTMADEEADAKLDKERDAALRVNDLKQEMAEEGSKELLELQLEAAQLQMEAELDNLELTEEEKQLIREKWGREQKRLSEEITNYEDNLRQKQAKKEEAEMKTAKKFYEDKMLGMASATSDAFGAMSDMLAAWGEENDAAMKASKAFAMIKILTDEAMTIADTAKAITAAVAGAAEAAAAGGPLAPVLIAAYTAEMVGVVLGAVASVASTIAQAKQILGKADAAENSAGKFAGGGIIGGTSFEGDRLSANVNSGEMIINREQQSRLFDIANGGAVGGFDYSAFASAVAGAVAAQPAPIVAFSEFDKARQKTTTYKNIARL